MEKNMYQPHAAHAAATIINPLLLLCIEHLSFVHTSKQVHASQKTVRQAIKHQAHQASMHACKHSKHVDHSGHIYANLHTCMLNQCIQPSKSNMYAYTSAYNTEHC